MTRIDLARGSDRRFAVEVRRYRITSDSAEGDGGRIPTPSPSGLLVGSIRACIVV